jgi:ferric-dicitrate binding protein FerR (iron transport regulator)
MQNDKYISYTVQDFLDDDAFVKWATRATAADQQTARFWETFPAAYPSSAENFNRALQFIQVYRTQDVVTAEDRKVALWSKITATIQEQPAATTKEKVKWLRPWMKIAASILLVAATGLLALQLLNRKQVVATDYGEKRTITLPDHSVVILNANSSLHYADKWDTTAPREVWLEGEAFFDVAHINKDTQHVKPHQRFIVHSDGITIEVLGTSFNVKSRRGKTNIGLVTGKIKVENSGESDRPAIVMLPGDYVEYGGESLLSNQKLERPEKLKDWTRKEIIFTDAALEEIIETLQDNYGYTVETNNDQIRQLKIEGEINVANVDELLTVISTTLNVKVNKSSEKHLVFYLGR